MPVEGEVTPVGSLPGLVLPKSVFERLKVGRGDRLNVPATPTGIVPTPLNPEVKAQLRAMDEAFGERGASRSGLSARRTFPSSMATSAPPFLPASASRS